MSLRQLDIFLYPPAINLLLFFLAIIMFYRFRKTAISLFMLSVVLLGLLSLPATNQFLYAKAQQQYIPISPQRLLSYQADAIVVLGARLWPEALEYGGGVTIAGVGLNRIRYAAFIARKTDLPIIVSGGDPRKYGFTEAQAMKKVLREEFLINTPIIEENRSTTTFSNALNSSHIAKKRGFKRVFLVTSSLHMQRAVEAFAPYGLDIIPAPTMYIRKQPLRWHDFIPRARAMAHNSGIFHEQLGRAWYALLRQYQAFTQ